MEWRFDERWVKIREHRVRVVGALLCYRIGLYEWRSLKACHKMNATYGMSK
jgi:hypothetical protein